MVYVYIATWGDSENRDREKDVQSHFRMDPPTVMSYLAGGAVMTIGVLLPLAYMFFRHSNSYA